MSVLLVAVLLVAVIVLVFVPKTRSRTIVDTYATTQGPPGPPGPAPDLNVVTINCENPLNAQESFCRFPVDKQGLDFGKTKLYSTDNGATLILDTSDQFTLTNGQTVYAEFNANTGTRLRRKDGRHTELDTPGDAVNRIRGKTTFADAVDITYTLELGNLGNQWTIDTQSGDFTLKYNDANKFITRTDGTLWQGWSNGGNICGCSNGMRIS